MIIRQNIIFITNYTNGEYSVLEDVSGQLMPRECWEELKKAMDSFYQKYTDFDIEAHNKTVTAERMKANSNHFSVNENVKKKRPGVVYFLGYEGQGVKIGYTRNLRGRLKQLQVASPHEIHLIGKITCESPEDVEREIHERFKEKLMVSEWYDLTAEEIQNCIQDYQVLLEE